MLSNCWMLYVRFLSWILYNIKRSKYLQKLLLRAVPERDLLEKYYHICSKRVANNIIRTKLGHLFTKSFNWSWLKEKKYCRVAFLTARVRNKQILIFFFTFKKILKCKMNCSEVYNIYKKIYLSLVLTMSLFFIHLFIIFVLVCELFAFLKPSKIHR